MREWRPVSEMAVEERRDSKVRDWEGRRCRSWLRRKEWAVEVVEMRRGISFERCLWCGGVGAKETGFRFVEFGFESLGSLSPLCGFLGGSTCRRHSNGGGDKF
ncbi:unnamed protein product [Fraxinus pennsylvanica]|uniref:Uncharacterized protein n=1 Tax=Fraxinus pennsylvanica TaxID=56036 RepID=A0AAD1ZQP6_9LAMI|nr:unnamed protein product [Fraxinus pennsylvanica]